MTLPRTIGRYEIEQELGRGGMGVVYRAIDPRLERAVAIKVLHEHLLRDSAFFSRFEREAKALAALSHPNIASILALEESQGQWYMVLEFVTGKTLADRLVIGAMPVPESLDVTTQIARALEAAHRARIMHRDLKPANVYIRDDGMVKVLDFGLSKMLAAGGAEALTSEDATVVGGRATVEGQMLGTPGYMSPEQARGQPVGPAADVFSWGCVLYECLSGAQAFAGETIADCIAAVLRSEPDWSALPRETPTRVEHVLRACLAKRPDDRPASMTAVRAELELAVAETSSIGRSMAAIEAHRPTKRTSPVTTNVADSPWPLLCRDGDVSSILQKLSQPGVVTLVGPSGLGKTRMVIAVSRRAADQFPAGRWFVRADRRLPPGAVESHLAAVMRITEDRERGLTRGLLSSIGDEAMLIVIDDAQDEESIGAFVEAVAATCAHARILVVANEALGVSGERSHLIRPLAAPNPNDQSAIATPGSFEAAGLFMQRASTSGTRPSAEDAPAIATLCRRVGGSPLAVQLLASRPESATLDAALQQFEVRLKLAAANPFMSPHEARLSAVVAWSLDLLSPAERVLFRRLRAFAGAFRPESIVPVCVEGELSSPTAASAAFQTLVARGIVVEEVPAVRTAGERRYRMSRSLTMAAESALAASGERAALFNRHLRCFADLAHQHAPSLTGQAGDRALAALVADYPDLLAAMSWALTPEADAHAGVRLAAALGPTWAALGQWRTGWQWLDRVLAVTASLGPSQDRAKVLEAAGRLAHAFGDDAGSEHAMRQSRDMLAALAKSLG